MSDNELHSYIGDGFQNAGAMRIKIPQGNASDSNAVLMENSSGLSMMVLQDRCLDIYSLKLCGRSVAFLSKAGIVHPSYYDPRGNEWLRSFGAGFLTTCGLTQAGEPCSFGGEELGLHGGISNTPAMGVAIQETEDEIIVSGSVRQYKFQFEDIVLHRTIHLSKKNNRLKICNRIVNEGWKAAPFMVLFHFNFGYPFLNPETTIQLPDADIEGWDEYSSGATDKHMDMAGPDPDFREQTFIHKLKDHSGRVRFALADRGNAPNSSVEFEYDAAALPYIAQWKHFKPGEYVMALEPCNNHVKGRAWEQENGTLEHLLPGESRQMDFRISFT